MPSRECGVLIPQELDQLLSFRTLAIAFADKGLLLMTIILVTLRGDSPGKR